MTADAPGKTDTRRFYESALTEAERAELPAALAVDGVEAEIAALRLRLKSALDARPPDFELVLRGMDTLLRLVAAKYKLSRGDRRQLTAFAQETLRRMQERGGGDADGQI